MSKILQYAKEQQLKRKHAPTKILLPTKVQKKKLCIRIAIKRHFYTLKHSH